MKRIPPLNGNSPIVDQRGQPTPDFLLLINELLKGGVIQAGDDAATALSVADAAQTTADNAQDDIDTLENNEVVAGVGLAGGGLLSDAAITLDLEDTAVVPDTYGAADKVPVLTIDQQGRVIDAEEVDVAGGGGGGGGTTEPSIIQSTFGRVQGGGSIDLTLGVAPTPGNVLLAIWNGAGGAGGGDPPSGFSIVGFNMARDSIYGNDSPTKPGGVGAIYQGCWLAIRRVQSGDSATVTFNRGSDTNNFALLEITDADIYDFRTQAIQTVGSDGFLVIRQRAPYKTLSLVVLESDGVDYPQSLQPGVTTLKTWNDGSSNHEAALFQLSDEVGDLEGSFAGSNHPYAVAWQINIAKYAGGA